MVSLLGCTILCKDYGQGIAAVIREVSGLDPAVAPGKGILENYHDFCRKKEKE